MISSNASYVFQTLGIDLIGPYPLSQNTKTRFILVITDYFSKWVELFPLRAPTAQGVCNCLLNNTIFRYGVPHNIACDNGKQFISTIFKEFCDRLSIKHIITTPYHPQTNLTKRVNRNIGRMITS